MNPKEPANIPTTRSASDPESVDAETISVRRHCKIARLPADMRDLLNGMLRDGAPYSLIIKTLRQRGHKISQACLSRWQADGFQDWLRDQTWLQEMRARLDFASAIVNQPNAELLDQASLRIAVTRMFTLLTAFDPATLQPKLAESPGAYVRVLNALCNLTETALKLQRTRDQKNARHTSSPSIALVSNSVPVTST